MKRYKCEGCGIAIIIESKEEITLETPILCQRCDPAYAALGDNKFHRPPSQQQSTTKENSVAWCHDVGAGVVEVTFKEGGKVVHTMILKGVEAESFLLNLDSIKEKRETQNQ